MQEILSEYVKNLTYFEDDKAQEQAAQRDHAGSFCADTQNKKPMWTLFCAIYIQEPAFTRRLDLVISFQPL